MLTWAHPRGIALRLIESGKLTQNAYIESFNGRLTSLHLLVTERGEPLTQTNLRRLFDKARTAAAAKASTEELRERIQAFQYRDLRAKAGTDRDEKEGREKARELLAHASDRMTDTYIRNRKGKLVRPSQGPKGG